MSVSLSQREKIILALGGCALLVILAVMAVVLPYRNALDRMDDKIVSRKRQLVQVRELQQEFRQVQQQAAEIDRRAAQGANFSLFSFIESTTQDVAGRENLIYLRPQPGGTEGDLTVETVEVKLEKIRLDQLVRLLYAAENADALLQVKNLRSKIRFDDPTLLDVVMTVSSFGKH
jgi:general secretion pathway protein M